jgi:hypothetical protein
MLMGIVDGQLYTEETRPNESAAFSEINYIMATLGLYSRDKHGNLVHDDLYQVVQADVFHRLCGEPLPKWFNKGKKKLEAFLNNRSKQVDNNPHYKYEEFTWDDASDLEVDVF